MNQGIWAEKGARSFNDGGSNYDSSSRIEPKRPHQWFIDGPEAGLFPNKKQAVGVPTTNLFTGLLNSGVSNWGQVSGFQPSSGPLGEQLFDLQPGRHANVDNGSASLFSLDKVNVMRYVEDDLFGRDYSSGLSLSHGIEVPGSRLDYGGIRKVKVSQVKQSKEIMPVSFESGYDNMALISRSYDTIESNGLSMGLAYNKGDGSMLKQGETFGSLIGNFTSMGQSYGRLNENTPEVRLYKEDKSTIGMMLTSGKSDAIYMVNTSTGKTDEKTMVMGHVYDEGNGRTNLCGQNFNSNGNGSIFMGQSHSKGASTIISFAGYNDETNPSGRLIANYEPFVSNPSFQVSEVNCEKESFYSNGKLLESISPIASSGTTNISRKKNEIKTSKKAALNSFPSNVRSLLSTGMLDGVPVKYIAWGREKQLQGVIKGTGYLCGCLTCNFSKVINAYEFERHASCKTKHPNNHIYCENGKTIYGIVQELRSTPQNMLFEVMQTITGSPINQKSFHVWKDSFVAASRELQLISGNE